jgi:hypothetical protein
VTTGNREASTNYKTETVTASLSLSLSLSLFPSRGTAMTRASKQDSKMKRTDKLAHPLQEQDEVMGGQQEDNTSITPLIGARTNNDASPMPQCHGACAMTESFLMPCPPPVRNNDDEDNISVLTDCSWMMDEEEDANSQVAASVVSESWTVVTSTTGSTTIPTTNTLSTDQRMKRRNLVSVARDNEPFKRRRKL